MPTAEGFYDYQKNMYIYQYKDHLGNIRMSYTKNKETNEITILDRNDYYPFGMNFNIIKKPKFAPKSGWENYKYNGKELQETGFVSMDYRNYMPDIGRFATQDPLSAVIPSWTPYRFAFNNPVYFSDPTGLIEESNVLATCPTCPKTPEFQPYIDDPKNTYVYVPETKTAEKEVQIQEVVVTGKKSESNTTTYLGFINDGVKETGGYMTKYNTGGTIGIWNTTLKNRSFDNINYSRLNIKYYKSGWIGNATVKTVGLGKYLEKGSVVGSVVLGAIEVGDGVATDYNDYQTKGETNGKNTVVASTKVATGAAAGYVAGAGAVWLTSALAGAAGGSVAPGVGTAIGFVVGAAVGYFASEYAGQAVENAYK